MKNFTFIIYALPGGGKGTQGKILKEKFNANYLASGDIIRQLKEEDTPLGKDIKSRYDQGIPQPDEIILEIFGLGIKRLIEQTNNKRLIIDGFPKTIKQAEFLDNICKNLGLAAPVFIYLDVDANSVIKRISNRLFCHTCGNSYLPSSLEFSSKICSKCSSNLRVRDDDKPEIVKARILDEEKRIKILVEYYNKNNRLVTIDGKPEINMVSQLIEAELYKREFIND